MNTVIKGLKECMCNMEGLDNPVTGRVWPQVFSSPACVGSGDSSRTFIACSLLPGRRWGAATIWQYSWYILVLCVT